MQSIFWWIIEKVESFLDWKILEWAQSERWTNEGSGRQNTDEKKSPHLICGIVQFLTIQLNTSIIGNLQSLEELDVTRCKKLSYNKLLELKLLPKLKLLNCLGAGDYDYRGMETKLKREMPYLIFSKYLEFANTRNSGNFIHDGIWEIKANHFRLFSLHYP